MKITLRELEQRVVGFAIYALCGSASITAGCRANADVLVLVWAQAMGGNEFDLDEIDAKTEQVYRYFEFHDSFDEPEPTWAIWNWPPSPSPSPSV